MRVAIDLTPYSFRETGNKMAQQHRPIRWRQIVSRTLLGPSLSIALAFAAFSLSSCTPAPVIPPAAAEPPLQPVVSGACQADSVQWAMGQQADQATLARIRRESGAGLVRPIAPGQAVTEDYRIDRVNVELDDANVIIRISCG